MPTQYVKVNGSTFELTSSSSNNDTATFEIPATESFDAIKEAFSTNTGDIQILYDETVMQVMTGFTVLTSIGYNNKVYSVSMAKEYNDAEALEIITTTIPNLEEAKVLRESIEKMSSSLPDEEAEAETWAFPAWVAPHDYAVGDRIRYNGLLYKVVQAHTSQPNWTPDVTPALYARVSDPTEEWPEWIQPTGAQDAYSMGDKVSHNEKHWISNANANVWEPGVYGWDEQATE